jgi:hypothetical protein
MMKSKTKRYGNGLYEVMDQKGRTWWLARDEKTKKWEARLTTSCVKPASTRDELLSKLEAEIGELQYPKKD